MRPFSASVPIFPLSAFNPTRRYRGRRWDLADTSFFLPYHDFGAVLLNTTNVPNLDRGTSPPKARSTYIHREPKTNHSTTTRLIGPQ